MIELSYSSYKKYALLFFILLLCGYALLSSESDLPPPERPQNKLLIEAYQNRQSNVQIMGEGVVSQLLADDNKGSRHQRFILWVNASQQVLVAHNIDLAPRINNLENGDTVQFFGEYEWNSKGGVIHWTHRDPANRHVNGWLKHQGHMYH